MHRQDFTACFLRTQRYNLDVRYKKGPLMIIADTRSHAHAPWGNASLQGGEISGTDETIVAEL